MFKTLTTIKETQPAEGKQSVSLPGERSQTKLANIHKTGLIELADKTYEKIKNLAA